MARSDGPDVAIGWASGPTDTASALVQRVARKGWGNQESGSMRAPIKGARIVAAANGGQAASWSSSAWRVNGASENQGAVLPDEL